MFDRHRRLLFTVAHQILGSVADAEDAVQDTWLRWSAADRSGVADPRAYLVPVTSRLALDRLGSARARRETYVGPWLPEPLLTGTKVVASSRRRTRPRQPSSASRCRWPCSSCGDTHHRAGRFRSARGVRDVGPGCGCGSEPIGTSRSPARAPSPGEHVRGRRPRFDTDARIQRRVTEQFFAACAAGDVDALLTTPAPAVLLVNDGGGKVKAALRPIAGAEVSRSVVAIAAAGLAIPGLRTEVTEVNGQAAIVGWIGTDPLTVICPVVAGGRIEQVLIAVNPDKLRRLLGSAR